MNAQRNFTTAALFSWLGSILLTLDLQAQPANDNFAARALLEGTNVVVNTSNVAGTMEPDEPAYRGGASLWWTWTAPMDCVCVLDTAGSTIQTYVGAFMGTSFSNLEVLEIDYDSIKFDASEGVTYQVLVDGYQGATGNVRLRLTVEPPVIGRAAPRWTLLTPTGTTVRSTDFLGKVVILDFWATWCGPCKVEIPDFVAMQNDYGKDGFVMVGASVDITSGVVSTFMRTNVPPVNYTVVMADAQTQNAYGGVSAIPTAFVIDRNNIVRRKYVGTRSKATFVSSVVPLLYGRLELSSGPTATLRWRPDGSPILEHTANLSTPVWAKWTGSPQLVNGTNVLQMPASGTGFFRLKYNY